MRYFYIFIFLAIFLISTVAIFSEQINASPEAETTNFLSKLKLGNIDEALKEFGDNTCHCAPKGGYVSYLKYELGHDPNLAFLLGHQFKVGALSRINLAENQPHILPWDKPESVYIFAPISFDPSVYSPVFIPLNMSFKSEIGKEDFDTFLKDPSKEWTKGFTLRLRPSLAPNTIPQAKALENSNISEAEKEFLPKDAAPIKLANNETIPAQTMTNRMPKLKSIYVRLKVVRRGVLRPWAINKIGLTAPVLLNSDGKEIPLK